MSKELKFCVDCTHCVKAKKPLVEGYTYWCRRFYTEKNLVTGEDKTFPHTTICEDERKAINRGYVDRHCGRDAIFYKKRPEEIPLKEEKSINMY